MTDQVPTFYENEKWKVTSVRDQTVGLEIIRNGRHITAVVGANQFSPIHRQHLDQLQSGDTVVRGNCYFSFPLLVVA
jgi:hypothetical protein